MPSFAITSVSASLAWLVDPADPSTAPLTFGTRTNSDPSLNVDGDYRQYSNGASQIVVYETQTSTVAYTLVGLTRDQRVQLENWRGKTLLLRTVDGDRWFVAYLGISPHRRLRTSAGVRYDVSITFNIVSYDESV